MDIDTVAQISDLELLILFTFLLYAFLGPSDESARLWWVFYDYYYFISKAYLPYIINIVIFLTCLTMQTVPSKMHTPTHTLIPVISTLHTFYFIYSLPYALCRHLFFSMSCAVLYCCLPPACACLLCLSVCAYLLRNACA